MCCFTSANPKQWHKYLSWAEFWYNSSYHTSLKTTPFKMVYGRDPPGLMLFEDCSTTNSELEDMLRSCDAILKDAKDHLIKTQAQMKNNADKKCRDLVFDVGYMIFLKLRPYRQSSLSKAFCQKLAAKYYGLFQVLERVGQVAYRQLRVRFIPCFTFHN